MHYLFIASNASNADNLKFSKCTHVIHDFNSLLLLLNRARVFLKTIFFFKFINNFYETAQHFDSSKSFYKV